MQLIAPRQGINVFHIHVAGSADLGGQFTSLCEGLLAGGLLLWRASAS